MKFMDIRDKEDRHAFSSRDSNVNPYLNKHTKSTRSPLAPKYYKATIVNKEIGIILLQDLYNVFPKALKVEII